MQFHLARRHSKHALPHSQPGCFLSCFAYEETKLARNALRGAHSMHRKGHSMCGQSGAHLESGFYAPGTAFQEYVSKRCSRHKD